MTDQRYIPETKGKSLEELEKELFNEYAVPENN